MVSRNVFREWLYALGLLLLLLLVAAASTSSTAARTGLRLELLPSGGADSL